jgi:hypothetical protein
MPRRRDPDAVRVVYRSARIGLRVTAGQRRRCYGLLRSAGDVWAAVLELNGWRYRRQDRPLASYQDLCRELPCRGRGRSVSWTPLVPGRCCAGMPMPGFRRRNVAQPEI